MRPLFRLPPLLKKANKVLQRGRALAFYRIGPRLRSYKAALQQGIDFKGQVLNEVLNFWSVHKYGRKTADLVLNKVKPFESGLHTQTQFFWE